MKPFELDDIQIQRIVKANLFKLLNKFDPSAHLKKLSTFSGLSKKTIEEALDKSNTVSTDAYIRLQYGIEFLCENKNLEHLNYLYEFIEDFFNNPEFSIDREEDGYLNENDINQLTSLKDFMIDTIATKKAILI